MRDAAREPRQVVLEDGDEGVVAVALVQEDRLAALDGQFQLPAEGALLVCVRGEVAEVVESALAGRADLRCGEQLAQAWQVVRAEFAGVVGMDARRRPKQRRIGPHEVDGLPRALERAARDHHVAHAGRHCGGHDLGAVVVEAVVGEIEADVDECGGGVMQGGLC